MREQTLEDIFPGTSEMARLMRAHDWASTSLGDPRGWPVGLKIPLGMLLTSRFEMWLGWGEDLHFFYNDAYMPTLGIKHPVMLGQPFREVWAEVYADVADQVEAVRAGQATWNKALLLMLERRGFPEETYHSFSYSPLYGDDGAVGGMLCIVTEETERVIGERRLEILRQLGMNLVGSADEAAVHRAVCNVFESYRRDFPFVLMTVARGDGIRALACTHDAQVLTTRDLPGIAAVAGEIQRIDLSPGLTWPNGEWDRSPHEALIVPIPGATDHTPAGNLILGLNPYKPYDSEIADFAVLIAGQVSGALANIAALDAERRRADRIWAHGRDIMVVVDAEGVFRSVSPAWTRILGHEIEEIVGRPFADFIAPDDLFSSNQALSAALGEGDLTGYENRFRSKCGDYRWFSWHTSMEDGLVYAYGRDITAHRSDAEALAAAEDALRQAQKMEAVGQLTGGIAHDFNNLLTGIIGSLDMMRRKAAQGKTDDVERYAQAAMVSANRAAALTHRLLAFSRRQSLDPKLVDPGHLVRGMEDLICRSIGEAIAVDFAIAEDRWATKCDPNQLESAVLNLAINARDAMPAGGRLSIGVGNVTVDQAQAARTQFAIPGDYVAIHVEDTGHGMSPDVLQRVFEPFFTTKPIGEGTGLGLSMIYGFARQSAGFVEIESTIDVGTAVRILLPRSHEQLGGEGKAADGMEEPQPHQGSTILVVEDEPIVRALVADALQEVGHSVLEAGDGSSALDLIRSGQKFDLLVTDVGLPGLNGRQLADGARAVEPGLKVLFVTGYAHDKGDGTSGWLRPGMEIITKPFAIDELVDRVRLMLDRDESTE